MMLLHGRNSTGAIVGGALNSILSFPESIFLYAEVLFFEVKTFFLKGQSSCTLTVFHQRREPLPNARLLPPQFPPIKLECNSVLDTMINTPFHAMLIRTT